MKHEMNKFGATLSGGLRKLSYLMYSLILLMFSLFIVGIAFIWALETLGINQNLAGTIASQLSMGFFAVALFNFKKDSILEPAKEFSFTVFWYGVRLTVLVLFINLLVSGLLTSTEGMPESTQSVIAQKSFIMTFLLPVIVAPVFEEFAFRAGFKNLLVDKGKMSNISYIIISSIIFGLLHWAPGSPTALAHIVLTGLMGVIYSITYIKSKNIYIPIVSHMLYNGLVITAASFV